MYGSVWGVIGAQGPKVAGSSPWVSHIFEADEKERGSGVGVRRKKIPCGSHYE